MTNREMLNYHNGLYDMQQFEDRYYKNTGKQFFKGKIKITFAIMKNMGTLKAKLKPYEEARIKLIKDYRDLDEEEAARKEREAKKEEAKKAGDEPAKDPDEWDTYIFLEGKTQEEYQEKLKELLDIDVEDVPIHMVDADEFDGLELSSASLAPFMFMIR